MKEETENIIAREGNIFAETLIENITDVVMGLDEQGIIVYANPSTIDVLGYLPEELEGKSLTGHVNTNDRDVWEKSFNQVRVKPGFISGTVSLRIRHKNGNWIYIEMKIRCLSKPFRNVCCIINVHDVIHHVETGTKLAESERYYRLITDNMTDFVWMVDVSTFKYLYASPSVKRLAGYTQEELMKMHPKDVLIQSSIEKSMRCFRKSLAQAAANLAVECPSFEVQVKHKNGAVIWTEVVYSLVRDLSGKVVAIEGANRSIAERKKAEEVLYVSEEKYRLLTENMNDMVVVARGDQGPPPDFYNMVFTYASLASKRITGYSPEEMQGSRVFDLVAPEDHNRFIEYLTDITVKATENHSYLPPPFEMQFICKDGRRVFIEETFSFIFDGNGDVIAGQGICRDISERKRLEERLRSSEEKYRFLAENINDMITTVKAGANLKYSYVNQAAKKMTGYTAEELMANYADKIIAPEYMDRFREFVVKAIETGKRDPSYSMPSFEVELIRKDGSRLWVEAVFNFKRDARGRLIEGISINRDITERKRLEAELREREKRYRLLAENTNDVIWLFDVRKRRFLYVSPSVEKVAGYTREEFLKLPPEKLTDGATLKTVFDSFLQVVEQAEKGGSLEYRPFEMRITCKDGSAIWFEVIYSPIYEESGQVLVVQGSSRDITARKKSEMELAVRTAELASSNSDLQHFAYIASHDLQEPLRMVASFTELLARRYKGKLDKEADEFISFIVDGTYRMKQLINDLLKYSRVETQGKDFVLTDCGKVIESVLKNLSVAITENHAKIEVGSLPTIWGDEVQLVQLFQNLLANAIKFHGDKLPEIEVSARLQNGNWLFAVRDNGIGIDPQNFEKIFGIFQRLHGRQNYPGTGIGLAVCKKIVERHGGLIWIESAPGKGSNFLFTLPSKEGV